MRAATVQPADLDKLAKLLGLAADPAAQPGEVAAAMAAARRILDRAGIGWRDVLAPQPQPATKRRQRRPASPGAGAARRPGGDEARRPGGDPASPGAGGADPDRAARDLAARLLREVPDLLTDWEAGFLASIPRQRAPLSARQVEVVEGIAAERMQAAA